MPNSLLCIVLGSILFKTYVFSEMGHFELFLAYFCENSWILSVMKDFVGSGPSSIKILATPLLFTVSLFPPFLLFLLKFHSSFIVSCISNPAIFF